MCPSLSLCRSNQGVQEGRRKLHQHKNIVGLDIGMHNVALTQEAHGKEELVGIRANRFHVQAYVFAEALDNLAEVHTAVESVRRRAWNLTKLT